MKILLAILLIIAVAVACGRIARAADVTPISRVQDARGVHIAYLVEASAPVAIIVIGGGVRISSVSDAGSWRATITGTLDNCHGALVVGGETVVQQRCTWLPEVVK